MLHGNTYDLVPHRRRRTTPRYGVLAEFLAEQLFGRWSLVLHYDLGRGLRAFAGRDEKRLKDMVALANKKVGDLSALTEGSGRDVRAARSVRPQQHHGGGRRPPERRGDHRPGVVPLSAGEPGRLNLQASSQLVTMLNWAMSPHVKRLNMAFVLVDEKLADLSDRLTGNPHVATIEVPLPDEPSARSVHQASTGVGTPIEDFSDFDARGAGDADRRHLADRSQRAGPVGARERQAARRARRSAR